MKSPTEILREACCTSFSQALRAWQQGADRIELCEELSVDGVTPGEENTLTCCSLPLPVNVLIRPRGGDFVYTPEEVLEMQQSIRFCRQAGAHGVVIGALDRLGAVDMDVMHALMQTAREDPPLSVTFHRAIDQCQDPIAALEQIIELGCDRILSSGHMPSAMEGLALLKQMQEKARGRIIIMPGGGVTADNVEFICQQTGTREAHGTRITENLEQ